MHHEAAAGQQAQEITPLQAEEAIAAGATLLDVREPDEFQAGHAPAAQHIPLGELEARLGEVSRNGTIVCVCRSGGRSMAAAQILASMGLDGVNLGGGMHAWAAEGLAIVTPNGAPGAII